MKTLAQALSSIKGVAKDFEGGFSVKNAEQKYFFVNDTWLSVMNMKREEVLGKTDDEILPPEFARFIKKTDREAVAMKGAPVHYIKETTVNGKRHMYAAIKWVVSYPDGTPFCYCMLAHEYENDKKLKTALARIRKILKESSGQVLPAPLKKPKAG